MDTKKSDLPNWHPYCGCCGCKKGNRVIIAFIDTSKPRPIEVSNSVEHV